MPKIEDIKKVLIIGSGPIVISQACEFDYSGVQAIKALKEEGIEVVLINSNPATIMTDTELADRTYVEPITPEFVIEVLYKERPDAILPTMGGQTALNTALRVAKTGVLDKLGIRMIGASHQAIEKAESRELFRQAIERIGLRVPKSIICRTLNEVKEAAHDIGAFPLVLRPAFTLGGTGSGVAYNMEDLLDIAAQGLSASFTSEVMVEESVLGWKELEIEAMRDRLDNVIIICSIENLDPMGVHTGDSITVAPAQTISAQEYERIRQASVDIMREVGVEAGGSNIQFASNPENGDLVVIELNPRVSRSSALASKATGVPIAKIATKLAIGYTMDELTNDITQKSTASQEPSIDYVVVKAPRWAFEKFPGSKDELTTAMKSVGETMAIGRTFKEALQKSLRGLEIGRGGLIGDGKDLDDDLDSIREKLKTITSKRIFEVAWALKLGMSKDELFALTKIDYWFLDQMQEIVDLWQELKENPAPDATRWHLAKKWGFTDGQIAEAVGMSYDEARKERIAMGILPTYKLVDTSAGALEPNATYIYSSYEEEDEARLNDNPKVMILGGGPNRIGQGIEFDYCCVHASFALKEMGIESVMVNCNPETVSTDYDSSDKLYFEPLTFEDVLNIVEREKPMGLIVQFGGQTPLNLSGPLSQAGVPILGTSVDAIDRAEDRDRFNDLVKRLNLRQPDSGIALSTEGALEAAKRIGYPVLLRPSYVLGGRAMEIVYDDASLTRYMKNALQVSPGRPILIDKFLEDAIEVDVDAVADGKDCLLIGIMEHIEQAGIHSGDSACVLPPRTLSRKIMDEIREATTALAMELQVKGLMNIQFAVKDELLYLLEVNPRASRTVPFVSKATGVAWAKVAARVMLGQSLAEQKVEEVVPRHISVKEAVLPFVRFAGVDPVLGPEMRSTGEVMGVDYNYGLAFAKSQLAAGQQLPKEGQVFISVRDKDKPLVLPVAQTLKSLGFTMAATAGTHAWLSQHGIASRLVRKVSEGRPNIVDSIINGEIQMVINTTEGKGSASDSYQIRRTALERGLPYITTISAASATALALEALHHQPRFSVTSLQDYYRA